MNTSQVLNGVRHNGAAADGSPVAALLAAVDLMADFCALEPPVPRPEVCRAPVDNTDVRAVVLGLHRVNALLWEKEDEVRREDATDTEVATAKRAIDRLNLIRHDHTEAVDDWLFAAVEMRPDAELHTEAAGVIVDRMSVLNLREFHYARRVADGDTTVASVVDDVQRQKADLRAAMAVLLARCAAGERKLQLYRAHKMYGNA